MKYKIYDDYDDEIREELPDDIINQMPYYRKYYEFETPEAALLELNRYPEKEYMFSSKTYNEVTKILEPLIHNGVLIKHNFVWKDYIYYLGSEYCEFVGQMVQVNL